ncbi:MAG: IS110 family transposase [Acidobacteria bacterium]|nr:IS110 family transposase [Acidobacteriota bacterium]
MEEKLKPYWTEDELLLSVPGIKPHNGPVILAEIGPTMEPFASGDHLCRWSGVSPGNNRSAGKGKEVT